jgi:hypothetical protein
MSDSVEDDLGMSRLGLAVSLAMFFSFAYTIEPSCAQAPAAPDAVLADMRASIVDGRDYLDRKHPDGRARQQQHERDHSRATGQRSDGHCFDRVESDLWKIIAQQSPYHSGPIRGALYIQRLS